MRRLVAGSAALLTVGALAACGPEEGTVVEKVHFPDLSYWTVATSCDGKSCHTIPQWIYVPECYRFKIRTPEDKLEDTCVKFGVYTGLQIGEYWRKT